MSNASLDEIQELIQKLSGELGDMSEAASRHIDDLHIAVNNVASHVLAIEAVLSLVAKKVDIDEAEALVGRQILCVDDDEASLDALTGLLERWQAECITAPAEDAAAVLGDEPMDAAILDYDLGPEAPNGLELAERLRAIRDVPCLLVTANRDRAIAAMSRPRSSSTLMTATPSSDKTRVNSPALAEKYSSRFVRNEFDENSMFSFATFTM